MAAVADETVRRLTLTQSIEHPGESGRARESIVRAFLRSFLPRSFDIDTGFVVDSRGRVSKQVDIVIYRVGYHPVLHIGGVRHFMVESVVAVLENKADIRSTAALKTALENIKSVKVLDRSAGGTNHFVLDHLQKGPMIDPGNPRHQIWGGIVAQASLSRESYMGALKAWLSAEDYNVWPNIYVDVASFAMYYLSPAAQGGHRLSLWPHGADQFGLTNPREGIGVSPLLDLAHAVAERLRTAGVVDYRPSNYFPTSSAVADRVIFAGPGSSP